MAGLAAATVDQRSAAGAFESGDLLVEGCLPRKRQAWESARPIPVEGGIKAKSTCGAIGGQWWSRRFIAVPDSYGMSSRLFLESGR